MRSRLAWLVLACGALAACTASREDPGEGRASKAKGEVEATPLELAPGVRVRVVDSARIYVSRGDAMGMPLPGNLEREEQSYVVEILDSTDERVFVRTLEPSASVCGSHLEAARGLELRFWVERRDLHALLAKPLTVSFPKGTKLELAAGVPVLGVGERGRVRVAGQELFVPIEDAAVGLGYTPPASPSPAELRIPLREGFELAYGEDHVLSGGMFGSASAKWPERGKPELEHMLEFRNPCGTFTLRAEGGALWQREVDGYEMKGPEDAIPRLSRNFDPEEMREHGDTFGLLSEGASFYGDVLDPDAVWSVDCSPRWMVPEGLELAWAEGRSAAGQVTRDYRLPASAQLRGGQVCFALGELELCVDADGLQHRPNLLCPGPEGHPQVELGEHHGRLTGAELQVGEGLERGAVAAFIETKLDELRACGNGELEGRMVLWFVAEPSGRVERVEIRGSTVTSAVMEMCVVDAVRRWTLPSPEGGERVVVSYPFDF